MIEGILSKHLTGILQNPTPIFQQISVSQILVNSRLWAKRGPILLKTEEQILFLTLTIDTHKI